MRLNLAQAKRPMHAGSNRQYAAWLDALTEKSGVYAIIMAGTREVLYVGESHSGRLKDTITRHFRRWKIDASADATGRRRGGTTYDRHSVMVAVVVTTADQATEVQFAEIERLQPRDNTHGTTAAANPPQRAQVDRVIGRATSITIDDRGQRRTIEFGPRAEVCVLEGGDYIAIKHPAPHDRIGLARTLNYTRKRGGAHFHDFKGRGLEAWGNPDGTHIVIGPGARAGSGWIKG